MKALRSVAVVAALAALAGGVGAATRGGSPAPARSQPGNPLNAEAPIEINADRLEVQQDRQLAIFRGNVEAAQGEMRLRADRLTVHYLAARSGQSRGGPADPGGAVSRIEAEGNVFVSSPQETAQGAAGIYDVLRKEIVLTGQVVLTRGDNVIRGDRLVLNLASGQSRVEGGGTGGRVRGLFLPPKSGESPTTR